MGNGLNGNLPSELGNLSKLNWINLGVNALTGELPTELGNLSNLTGLYLQSNQLQGDIPNSLLHLCDNTVNLSGNNFNTTWSEFCDTHSTELNALIALYNSTDGPNWTNNTGWVDGAAGTDTDYCSWYGVKCDGNGRVEQIILESNQLRGTIPVALGDLTNLETLRLQKNQLTGCIPSTFSNLCGQSVQLYGNSFPSFSDFCASGTACLTVPSNDLCQNAFDLPVTAACQYQSFTLIGAQASNNPTQYLDCGDIFLEDNDVWFTAIVPASGNVKIQLDTYGTAIEAYSWTCNNLTPFYCSAIGLLEITGRTPGEVIFMRVMQPFQASAFNICAVDEASNQNCEIQLVELGAQSACDPITNTYMQEFIFHLDGIVNNGYIYVLDQEFFPTTNPFIANVELPALTQSGYLDFSYIYDGINCDSYYVRGLPLLPPCGLVSSTNDDCMNAIEIDVTKHCENEYEYLLPSSVNAGSNCLGFVDDDVWFKTIVPPSGNLTVFTQEKNILLTTALEVYRGADCNTLSLVSNPDCSLGQVDDVFDIVDAIPGEVLYIRVAHTARYLENKIGQGDFSICAIEHEPVDNNDCSQAVVLTPTSQADAPYIVRNNYAQPSGYNNAFNCGNENQGDLWFKIENPSSSSYRLELNHPALNDPHGYFSIKYELYEGSCDNLIYIGCSYGLYPYTTSNDVYLRIAGQSDEHHFLAALSAEYLDHCPEEQKIVQGLIGDYNFHSAQSITASNDVEFKSIVDFKAGNCIELLPSFEVHEGATFTASIENCLIVNSLNTEKDVLKSSNNRGLRTIKGEDGYYYTVKEKKGMKVIEQRIIPFLGYNVVLDLRKSVTSSRRKTQE